MNLKAQPGMFVLFQVECLYDEFCNPIHKKYPFDSSCEGFPSLVLKNQTLATHIQDYRQELSVLNSEGRVRKYWIANSNFVECLELR